MKLNLNELSGVSKMKKFNKTKVKVWVTRNAVWFEQRDPETNQTYFVSNTGREVTFGGLFKNYSPVPFSI
jgi:hypothetical protein